MDTLPQLDADSVAYYTKRFEFTKMTMALELNFQHSDLYLFSLRVLEMNDNNAMRTKWHWFRNSTTKAKLSEGVKLIGFDSSYLVLTVQKSLELWQVSLGYRELVGAARSIQRSVRHELRKAFLIIILITSESIRFGELSELLADRFHESVRFGRKIDGLLKEWSTLSKHMIDKDESFTINIPENIPGTTDVLDMKYVKRWLKMAKPRTTEEEEEDKQKKKKKMMQDRVTGS